MNLYWKRKVEYHGIEECLQIAIDRLELIIANRDVGPIDNHLRETMELLQEIKVSAHKEE